MEKGGRATWLASAFRLPPSQRISTFPIFPRTSVSGKAFVKGAQGLQEVSVLMENEYPVSQALMPIPAGSMDDDGHLHFTSKAIPNRIHASQPAQPDSNPGKPTYFQAVDESWWTTQGSDDGVEAETFAVLLGYFVGYYPSGTPVADTKNIRAAIIEKHAEARFHVRSYLMFSRTAKAWVQTWPKREFSVGGSQVHVVKDLGEDMPSVPSAGEQYLNNPQSGISGTHPSLEGQVIRRA
ncbi:hypothetical protein PT974_09676 [Cladobotryum mycophilum]|uniref:Uncharacterized protein n=1 Tax=Cladobotryum mycophilum TaxID=491253 RepID=A0ABR0SI18_9HYPO